MTFSTNAFVWLFRRMKIKKYVNDLRPGNNKQSNYSANYWYTSCVYIPCMATVSVKIAADEFTINCYDITVHPFLHSTLMRSSNWLWLEMIFRRTAGERHLQHTWTSSLNENMRSIFARLFSQKAIRHFIGWRSVAEASDLRRIFFKENDFRSKLLFAQQMKRKRSWQQRSMRQCAHQWTADGRCVSLTWPLEKSSPPNNKNRKKSPCLLQKGPIIISHGIFFFLLQKLIVFFDFWRIFQGKKSFRFTTGETGETGIGLLSSTGPIEGMRLLLGAQKVAPLEQNKFCRSFSVRTCSAERKTSPSGGLLLSKKVDLQHRSR